MLVRHWAVPEGGLIVFDYGAWKDLGVPSDMPRIMFDEFTKHMLSIYQRGHGTQRSGYIPRPPSPPLAPQLRPNRL